MYSEQLITATNTPCLEPALCLYCIAFESPTCKIIYSVLPSQCARHRYRYLVRKCMTNFPAHLHVVNGIKTQNFQVCWKRGKKPKTNHQSEDHLNSDQRLTAQALPYSLFAAIVWVRSKPTSGSSYHSAHCHLRVIQSQQFITTSQNIRIFFHPTNCNL